MTKRHVSRRALDGWFGTIVRYTGFGMLLYCFAVDKFRNPALFPAALAMMFLKNVAGAGE